MAVEDDVRHLRKILIGNGDPGVVGRLHAQENLVAGIRHDLTENTKTLNTLVRERRDEAARREGTISTLKSIKWLLSLVLTIVLIGGAVAGYQLDKRWEAVQQQIQRIPAIPE